MFRLVFEAYTYEPFGAFSWSFLQPKSFKNVSLRKKLVWNSSIVRKMNKSLLAHETSFKIVSARNLLCPFKIVHKLVSFIAAQNSVV